MMTRIDQPSATKRCSVSNRRYCCSSSLNQPDANERARFQYRTPASPLPCRCLLILHSRSALAAAERIVTDNDFEINRRCDQLNGIDADLREGGAQNFVTAYNVIEGAL